MNVWNAEQSIISLKSIVMIKTKINKKRLGLAQFKTCLKVNQTDGLFCKKSFAVLIPREDFWTINISMELFSRRRWSTGSAQ